MGRLLSLGMAAAVTLASTAAWGKPVGGRRLGVGLMVGQPTAVTGYLSLLPRLAADLALGWVSIGYHAFKGHASFQAIFADPGGPDVQVPFYIGIGWFAIEERGDWFSGPRVPLGLAIHIPSARLQLFGEVAVQVAVMKSRDTPRSLDTEAAAGIRFFF